MRDTIVNILARHGELGTVVPFRRVADLQNDVLQLKAGKDYDACGIPWMATDPATFVPDDLPFTPRSVIVTLSPSPRTLLHFTVQGQAVTFPLPPTYADYGRSFEIQRYLADELGAVGYSAAPAYRLPQKLLAVRSGLGLYGRNYICYSPEFGSYQLINSFFTDAPCDEAAWQPIGFLPACETCRACSAACPTGALEPSRGMLNANRCLTYLNEKEGDFPPWAEKGWHNAVVGCLKCQDACPYNQRNADREVDLITFDEAETDELLNHEPGQAYTDALREKIESVNLQYYQHLLGRNLRALLG